MNARILARVLLVVPLLGIVGGGCASELGDDGMALQESAAALVSVDTVFGAGTATLDPDTGLHWLDLTLTTTFTFDAIQAATAPGGTFGGFHLATADEVLALWAHAGINTADVNQFTTENFAPASILMNLMGGRLSDQGNLGGGNNFDFTQGYIATPSPFGTDWFLLATLSVDPDPTMTGRVGFGSFPKSEESLRLGNQGAWLVSDAVPSIGVTIDIKPGSVPNSINRKSNGNVPVAVLGSATFDVRTIDRKTVTFAGATALKIGGGVNDVDGDGVVDTVFHFRTPNLVLPDGAPEACLQGRTLAGVPFAGCDSVRVVR